ncbi:MAG: bacillithiol system redox-active protein YtxJ [Firmicutes bacterium]|nr:bacillithiol system redox-active protein YtxJ [Bacillota bacterium]
MARAEVIRVLTPADVDRILALSARQPVFLFKHSTTCPISHRAHREWQAYLADPAPGVAHALVRVREERTLSLALAERLGVAHASPQAILFHDGRPLWHASHHAITRDALRRAALRHGAGP